MRRRLLAVSQVDAGAKENREVLGVESVMPCRKAQSRLPTIPAKSVPLLRSPLKQSEKPQIHQRTVVNPIDTKLCIMMVSTLRRPTSPP
jgi:hypothetical protein